jgi:hypothetical protein
VLIVVVAAVLAVGIFIGTNERESASSASPPASSAPTTSDDGSFPATLGGEPRLTGETADAFENLFRSMSGGELGAFAAYGSGDLPVYYAAEIGPSFLTGDDEASQMLTATAGGANLSLSGPTEYDPLGQAHTACRATTDTDIRFLCVTDDGERVVMIFGTVDPPAGDHVAIAREAVG